jgi:hypothetical protein
VTSSTTGSAVTLVARSCQVLGFYASATTTLTIYDSIANATTSQQGATFSAVAVGWNPLPLDLINGLTVTQGAQLTFVVV